MLVNGKADGVGRLETLLSLLIGLNIVGDLGNIALWYASPDSQGSLREGYIATVTGQANALTAGATILLVVAIIYAVAAFGRCGGRS